MPEDWKPDYSRSVTSGATAASAMIHDRRVAMQHIVRCPHRRCAGADPTGAATSAVDFASVYDAAKHELDRVITEVGPPARGTVLTGGSAASLIDLAKQLGARLIVVGTHGRTGLGRLLVGSTAEAVARGASCSVLVIPSPSPET